MKILIVDDELKNRRLLREMVRPYGHCDLAKDGQEAVESFSLALAEGEPYHLVLLDIMMPGMNGQDALKAIRARERAQHQSAAGHPAKEAIILMVTAVDAPKQVVEAFYRGGCSDYLIKPISRPDLEAKLAEYHLLPAADSD